MYSKEYFLFWVTAEKDFLSSDNYGFVPAEYILGKVVN